MSLVPSSSQENPTSLKFDLHLDFSDSSAAIISFFFHAALWSSSLQRRSPLPDSTPHQVSLHQPAKQRLRSLPTVISPWLPDEKFQSEFMALFSNKDHNFRKGNRLQSHAGPTLDLPTTKWHQFYIATPFLKGCDIYRRFSLKWASRCWNPFHVGPHHFSEPFNKSVAEI